MIVFFYFLETYSYSPKLTEGQETNIPCLEALAKKGSALFSMCWIKFSGEKFFLLIFRQYKTWYWDKKKIRVRKRSTRQISTCELFKVFNFTRTNAFYHLKTLSRNLFLSQIIPHKVLWKLQTIKSEKKWKFAGCRHVVRMNSAQRKNIFLLNINIFFLIDVTF